jgi:hypothetical protein
MQVLILSSCASGGGCLISLICLSVKSDTSSPTLSRNTKSSSVKSSTALLFCALIEVKEKNLGWKQV